MPLLKLVDILAIAAPERGRLVEVDDAIRDLVRAVETAADRDGHDRRTLSRAIVGVLAAAAARQAMKAYPSMSQAELKASLAALVDDAVEWASRRALRPGSSGGEEGEAQRRTGRQGDAK